MHIAKKYKGGILLYAVFISFIISIFCGAIILIVFYFNINIEKFLASGYLQDESISAINYAFADNKLIDNGERVAFQLNENYNTTIQKKQWGAFDYLVVKSDFKTDSIVKLALVGSLQDKKDKTALMISNPVQNISICGNVIIKGNCYIPKGSFKKTSIEGRSLDKQDITNDLVQTGNSYLPNINEKIFDPVKKFNENTYNKEYVPIETYLKNGDNIISNSFSNPSLILYSKEKINLQNILLKGNIIIISNEEIVINDGCKTDDIICISRKVRLSSSLINTLQVYATDEIIVEENIVLAYPSALILYSDKKEDAGIVIKENSDISGAVILYCDQTGESKIVISRNSLIKGLVYSTNYIEHKGKIYGSLFASKLWYSTKSGYYDNLLMDAEINMDKLSEYYIDPCIFSNYEINHIIKWLN